MKGKGIGGTGAEREITRLLETASAEERQAMIRLMDNMVERLLAQKLRALSLGKRAAPVWYSGWYSEWYSEN